MGKHLVITQTGLCEDRALSRGGVDNVGEGIGTWELRTPNYQFLLTSAETN